MSPMPSESSAAIGATLTIAHAADDIQPWCSALRLPIVAAQIGYGHHPGPGGPQYRDALELARCPGLGISATSGRQQTRPREGRQTQSQVLATVALKATVAADGKSWAVVTLSVTTGADGRE